MRWYNGIGLLIIIVDFIGGILGFNGTIFRGWNFIQGGLLFLTILIVGLFLYFTSFEKETKIIGEESE